MASSILKTSFDQLDQAKRQLIFDLYENSVSTPLIGQVLHSRTGLTYSNAKVAYHAGQLDKHYRSRNNLPITNDINAILGWLTTNKYDHIMLFHDSTTKTIRTEQKHTNTSKSEISE